MEVTKETTYLEMKKDFLERIEMFNLGDKTVLPVTLDNKYMYYLNVPNTIMIYINQIDSEFERLGKKNIKKSAVARANKTNLYRLAIALKNKHLWNLELPTLEERRTRVYD